MSETERALRIYLKFSTIATEFDAFLLDRQACGLSPRTIAFYREKLGIFQKFLAEQDIGDVQSITPAHLRMFLIQLAEGHNPGGVHAVYRTVKAFLNWWEQETEPENWTNPLDKTKPPKLAQPLLEPVQVETVKAMLATCQGKTFHDARDKAIFLTLLDSGCRASEFIALNISDVNLKTGAMLIRRGKGGKGRMVFLGVKARKALLAYLRYRSQGDALWVTREGKRLAYTGLRDVVRRRARMAGVSEPSLHSFRRGFALESLKNGADIVSLQRMMGHSSTAVLTRYLRQQSDDLAAVHQRTSPVDRLKGV